MRNGCNKEKCPLRKPTATSPARLPLDRDDESKTEPTIADRSFSTVEGVPLGAFLRFRRGTVVGR